MKRHRSLLSALPLVLILSVLLGCGTKGSLAPTPTPTDLVATPFTQIGVEGDKVMIELGLNVVQPEDVDTRENPFLAHWELTNAQGEVLAQGSAEDVPSQSADVAGNARYIDQWQGVLQPGTYQVMWGAPGYGYTHDEFDVVVAEETVKIENVESTLMPQYPED
jgi:predicted small lipoprotein YifL